MPVVNASAQLRASAARLRVAGESGIRLRMVRDLRAAAQPAIPFFQESARQSLPKAGGLNEAVAAQKPKVSVRTTGRTAGVSIRSKVRGNYTNTGQWRHPVFANGNKSRRQWKWVLQSYPSAKEWWDRGARMGEIPAKVAMNRILAEVAEDIMRRGL